MEQESTRAAENYSLLLSLVMSWKEMLVEVTYCSTYSDLWRCTLYSLTRRREIWLRLAFPVIYGTFPVVHEFKRAGQVGWVLWPISALVMTLAFGVLLAFILQILVVCRLLIPASKRRCTTTLTAEGFTDVTERKTAAVPWSVVSDIRYGQGDIYFWRKGKDGMFVPRSAFRNSQHSEDFYHCALSLWNAAKAGSPFAVRQDETVWPPAPRSGG